MQAVRPLLGFRRQTARIALGGAGLLLAASLLLFITAFLTDNAGLMYESMAVIAFLIPLSVGLSRGSAFDMFEPINLAAVAILVGSVLPGLYLLTNSSSWVQFMMYRQTFPEVLDQLPWIMLGVIAMTVGYVVMPYRVALEEVPAIRNFRMTRRRLWLAIGMSIAISLVGIVSFIVQYDISLSESLLAQSHKRVLEITTDTGDTVYGAGIVTPLSQFTQYGLYLLVGALAAGAMKLRRHYVAAALGLMFLASIVPFFSSSRTQIIFILISVTAVLFYYGRIRLRVIVIGAALILAIGAGMGMIRGDNSQTTYDRSVLDQIAGSGNGVDFIRTAGIMERVPRVRDFEHGRTYLAVTTGFIPRSWWPEKPPVSLGAYVKGELFGEFTRRNGWPPGLMGEAHINFGKVGIAVVMLLFGILMRFIYESVRPGLGRSFLITIAYSALAWWPTYSTLCLNAAMGLLHMIVQLVGLAFIILIAGSSRITRTPSRVDAARAMPAQPYAGS